MFPWTLWICAIVLVGSGAATDVPFVFDENVSSVASYTPAQIEQAHTSSPELAGISPVTTAADNTIMDFPVVGGGSNPQGTIKKNVNDLKNLFDTRVEPDHFKVRELAKYIVGDHPGELTIDQVSAIFSYLIAGDNRKQKVGWSYVGPPRGVNNFFYANETIMQSENQGYVGCGDCGDFAILMSALVESIGGKTRIILANNNSTGSHAYVQVYIGRDDIPNSLTEEIIKYLMKEFDTNKIFANIDTNTKDVWLNLDWWKDEMGNPHPGGPLFPGENNIVLYIREIYPTNTLKLPEKTNSLPRLIKLIPNQTSPQEAGTTVIWTAGAKDLDKDLLSYRFFLNGIPKTEWIKENQYVWDVTDDYIGDNQIEVRVRDGKHADPVGFDSRKVANFTVIESIEKSTNIENQIPIVKSLVSDRSSPADAGTAITWTVVAKDAENDSIFYRFLLDDVPVTKWMMDNVWIWNTTDENLGNNQIEVQVRDGIHQENLDNKKTASFTIVEPRPIPQAPSNRTPVIDSLALDKSSPQDAGASITWTATAYDPENDPLFYRFLLNGRPATDWTSDKVWNWLPTEKDVGNNQIDVQLRDGKHAGPNACDDSAAADFEIWMPNQPPTLTGLASLNSDQPSPQDAGTDIVWTVLASDPDGDPVLCRFLLNGKPVTDWSIGNTWIWKTAEEDEGENLLEVRVRDGMHAGPDGFDDKTSESFVINQIEEKSNAVVLGGDKTYSYVPGPAYSSYKPSYIPAAGAYPIGSI